MNPTRPLPFLFLFLATALPALPAQDRGKQHKSSQAPFLKPDEAVAAMDIPDGFDVSVFASEPTIGEPIAFTFDNRGRVWVVENYNYINRRSHNEEEILSRIQILEDVDSDGMFDTAKTFSDQITFASGIAVGHGGVFLGAPPNLVFIPDANGDDIPDGEPELLLDGWGFHDRHETLNSFIWGPDGWLYGCHGVFTRSYVGKPGTPDKDRTFIDAGIWRFHPVTKEFEIFARGLSNPWGFDFNDVGHGFATCCVIPHLFHVVQGGIYHKQSKPHVNPYVYDDIKTIRDHTHLSAHGGARFYLADTFPAEYRDQLFMCNIHEHAVLTDIMVPKGASYVGTHGEDFMPTNDLAWVGFSMEIGPEGGVYILDWHDTDICGNAINFPKSGRIYQIMPEGAKPIERPNLSKLSDLELVGLQKHRNDWYVRQARTELHYRSTTGKLDRPKVHRALDANFAAAKTSAQRLRQLWASHVTGRFLGSAESELIALLDHTDEHVRAWGIQLLCEDRELKAETVKLLVRFAMTDPSPTVRQYLASAAGRLPIAQRWELLAALANNGEDVDDALIPRLVWYALEPAVTSHPEKALAVATEGKFPFLTESVARRLVSGKASTKPGKGPHSPERLAEWNRILKDFAPGFEPGSVGEGGIRRLVEFRNEKGFQTHPKSLQIPCTLNRRFAVPEGKTTKLKVRASYHAHGDWQLRVLVGKEILHDQIVSNETVNGEWLDLEIDLSRFAGREINLVVENRANDWLNEFGYWGKIEVLSE